MGNFNVQCNLRVRVVCVHVHQVMLMSKVVVIQHLFERPQPHYAVFAVGPRIFLEMPPNSC
jgi:hypothetical protein